MNKYDRQRQNIEVFTDTLYFIHTNKTLTDATEKSIESTVIYREWDYPEINNNQTFDTNFLVTKSRTFEAAIRNYKEHIDKNSELVHMVKAWVDEEYEGGRVTVLTDQELLKVINEACDRLGVSIVGGIK